MAVGELSVRDGLNNTNSSTYFSKKEVKRLVFVGNGIFRNWNACIIYSYFWSMVTLASVSKRCCDNINQLNLSACSDVLYRYTDDVIIVFDFGFVIQIFIIYLMLIDDVNL